MPLDLSLQIDTIQAADLTEKDFKKNYFYPQKPLLIKGLANQFPAGKKWTIDYFRKIGGHHTVEVFDNRKKHDGSTYVKSDLKINLNEFLDIIEKDEYSPLRMFVYDMFKRCPELKKDFHCPDFFNGLLGNIGMFFMGGKNTEVPLHYDVDYNNVLLTQIYGSKRVILIEPKYSHLLYQLPFTTMSPVNLDNPDYDKYPGLHFVKGYKVIQEPGDGVFMPTKYWHYNVYLNGGIAVSYRKLNKNPVKSLNTLLSFGVTLPFDKVMTRMLGDKWFDYKKNKAESRAIELIKSMEAA